MQIDLSKIKHVHFIGIGGIGISAIARMMLENGKEVSGQDMQDSDMVNDLRKMGAEITIGQSFENIPKNADLIVYTIAIEYYDPQLFGKLKEQSIPIKSYPEMLGLVSGGKYTIAVAGTHGKTTTTGMIARILCDAGKDPTVVVGSLLKVFNTKQMKENLNRVGAPEERVKRANFPLSAEYGETKTNFISGDSDLFVVEACEYRRSFLNINPNILVITNIDADHLDYYKDIEDIKSAFRELVLKVPEDGFVICDPEDKNIKDVIDGIKTKIIDYKKFFDNDLKLKIPGRHNKLDASMAIACAHTLGIAPGDAKQYVSQFSGTSRRFEYKGDLQKGIKLYDDYAHHPVEIQATLQGFRELYDRQDGWKITVIFQPHLFSRTKSLLGEFAKSFREADEVIVLPIYFAREEDDGTISEKILAEKINDHTSNAKSFSDFESTEKYIRSKIENMDEKNIIVTMGAGEAFKIGDSLLK